MFVAEEIERLVGEEGLPLPRRRDLLPDERAEPRARGRVHADRRAVQGVRRRAVLPAQGDQGRPGVPAAAREPAGRDQLPPRGQHAEARDRRRHGGRRRVASRRPRASPSLEAARRVDEIVTLAAAREGRGRRLPAGHGRARPPPGRRRRPRAHGRVRRAGVAATWPSSRRSARSRRRAASRTSRSSRAWPPSSMQRDPEAGLREFLEQVSLVGEQDEYEEEDSAVTLMTLHIAKGLEFPAVFIVGHGGRDLPALPIDDGLGRAGGGAPARVRGHHARARAAVPHATRGAARSSARRSTTRRRGS